jgi:hypothetical protein
VEELDDLFADRDVEYWSRRWSRSRSCLVGSLNTATEDWRQRRILGIE